MDQMSANCFAAVPGLENWSFGSGHPPALVVGLGSVGAEVISGVTGGFVFGGAEE